VCGYAIVFRSERENVDEDILAMGKGAYKVMIKFSSQLPPVCEDARAGGG
jgi:hypothetical protein